MTDISREALGKAIYTATARTLPAPISTAPQRDLIVIAEALRDRVDELEIKVDELDTDVDRLLR